LRFISTFPVTAVRVAAMGLALCGAEAYGQFVSNAQPLPAAQANTSTTQSTSGSQQSNTPYQGSVVKEKATAGQLSLSLQDAIERGLKYNLGYILQNEAQLGASGQRLQALQTLLPTAQGGARITVAQTDLAAEGLRITGFPKVIGPYGSVDFRASVVMSLLNLPALQNYLAARHNFQAAKLSVQDARDMVVLAVGNAYLTVIADQARVTNAGAQVRSTKTSLDQAVANHTAGTSPLLDELRARVDYQTQEQTLIQAQNQLQKDKIALARAIGLPLEQEFVLSDSVPYTPLDNITADEAAKQALAHRKDLAATRQQAAEASSIATGAHEERLPSVGFTGDYGATGINLADLHGSGEAIGQANVPLFEEAKIRGDERIADAQKRQQKAQVSNLEAQVVADVRDSLLDIEAAAKLVEVARSNVDLATEELSEAQQRFAAGVSDNLSVVQAQASVAQANEQYVSSLYQHNMAKLSLARAMGVAQQDYSHYLGGK
jgi:outer membrane protein TolC